MKTLATLRRLGTTVFLASGMCLTSCVPGGNNDAIELYDARPVPPVPLYAIGVPADPPQLLPGEAQTVQLILSRPWGYGQDVNLRFESACFIEIAPAQLTVKREDKSAVQVELKAANQTPAGEFLITVRGSVLNAPHMQAQFRVQVLPKNPVATCRTSPCLLYSPLCNHLEGAHSQLCVF